MRLAATHIGQRFLAMGKDQHAARFCRPPPDEAFIRQCCVVGGCDGHALRRGDRRPFPPGLHNRQVPKRDGAGTWPRTPFAIGQRGLFDKGRITPTCLPVENAIRAESECARRVQIEKAPNTRMAGFRQVQNGWRFQNGHDGRLGMADRGHAKPDQHRCRTNKAPKAPHGCSLLTAPVVPQPNRPGKPRLPWLRAGGIPPLYLALPKGKIMRVKDVKKVVLAYSGGLDTSVILKWLQTTYKCEVITFTADLGQGEELGPARDKALLLGIKPENIFMDDLREEFIRDFVFPMFRANALYEGMYLLGTSIARPLIAKRQIEIAEAMGADAVAHGATGKGNDQVRFELSYYALKPDVKVIAPWREWDLTSRTRLIQFAEEHQIPIAKDKRGEAPFSVDANLLHSSSEGKILEEPWDAPDEMVWQRTISPMDAPDRVTEITIEFERGDAVGINGERLSPATLLTRLNALGKENGIGRLDLVENRFVGMKSRGCYETPGGTILYVAHRAMESITLDREAAHLKDSLMPRYAEIIYNGFWFAPERRMLQALIDESQHSVSGTVRLKLYKGNTIVTGRQSPNSLYSMKHVTFEDDQGAYDQFDAQGFIKLNALRLRLGAMAGRKGGQL